MSASETVGVCARIAQGEPWGLLIGFPLGDSVSTSRGHKGPLCRGRLQPVVLIERQTTRPQLAVALGVLCGGRELSVKFTLLCVLFYTFRDYDSS